MVRRKKSRGGDRWGSGGWPEYVPVAERRKRAAQEMAALKKKGVPVDPVVLEGRTIAKSVWGKAWCYQLERFADFDNRLERGRTYVRNGSVVDLQLGKGTVTARVSGSEVYKVSVTLQALSKPAWKGLTEKCAGKVGSLVELLTGKLSTEVMGVLAAPKGALLPTEGAMQFSCSCPDGASLCKHVAAALYGVGARLDTRPELLFTLRDVDPSALLAAAARGPALSTAPAEVAAEELESVFGITLEDAPSAPAKKPAPAARKPAPAAKKSAPAAKKSAPTAKTASLPARITAKELLARGVPRSVFQNWTRNGGLLPTGERGVYEVTPKTQRLIDAALLGK